MLRIGCSGISVIVFIRSVFGIQSFPFFCSYVFIFSVHSFSFLCVDFPFAVFSGFRFIVQAFSYLLFSHFVFSVHFYSEYATVASLMYVTTMY